MTTQQILFVIAGAIILGAALVVVTRRNVFHAALFLILSFFGVAGLYVLLEAPFLAAVQLATGIGGIATMIILAVTLTQDRMNPNVTGHNRQWWAAMLVSVALCGVLAWVTLQHDWETAPGPVPGHSMAILRSTLLDPRGFALPFAITPVLLVVAFIGAVRIARKR
jgi:NADH:ubiquinone oxidoreductase subunit 6 (subunit J)